MMLLDSISCPTVPPATGHTAGCVNSRGCLCVSVRKQAYIHVIVRLQNQKGFVCVC